MKRSGKKSVEKSRQESHKQTSSQEFVSSDSPKQTSISKQQSAASRSGSIKTQKQASKQESAASGFSSTKTQKQASKQESAASGSGSIKTQKQTSKQESAASGSGSTKTQKQTLKQESAASGSGSIKTQKKPSGSGSIKTQKQTLKQQSAASGSGSIKTQKQTSIPEASENNGPFRLVELTPITRTAEPYRSNVHRELTPITRTTEPYRSNVRIAEPYRSNVRTAEPYRRELTPIIREPYSSNWTRDVNETYDLREENAYLRGRIDELNRQLDNANGELRDLRLDVGQLQSYNNILSQENDGLRHRHSSDLQDIEFEEDQRPTKRRKGKNLVRDSEDEMEVDEEEARVRPKILFQYKDNRRLHRNNRLNEKKARRVKGAKSLFDKNDEKLENYDRKELLNVLSDNRYHSPEYSESDEEQPDSKRHINVYNLSWRSKELIDLLRNVLDQHAFSLQSAQLIRTRNYDDEIYNIVSRHPRGAPNWTYVEQNMPADTDFSEPETPIQTMENLIMVEDAEVSAEMDEIVVIEDSEPTGMEESEPTEMEESEPTGVEELEPMGVEESPETEDETDKWYKFVL
ncbi:unnamed protein product [Rhizophagus irregularis]|nr:unnamed protein product [Rhizophagus irregularis]